jgi:hypothetical protein
MGMDKGEGITREQSVRYPQWILTELEIGRRMGPGPSPFYENLVEPVGLRKPMADPNKNL